MAGFSEIVGHEEIIKNMRSAIRSGKTPHALILDGPAGSGKKTLANAFAQTLFCREGEGDACGYCVSCRTFINGSHPDVHYVVPGNDRKAVGVDDVREQIIHEMETKPYQYPYKVFIMGAADGMKAAAQNALLKEIEEPAPYGVFIFLSESLSAFLPTILSRCVILKLKPLSVDLVKKHLLTRGLDEGKAAFYAEYSRGNLGLALRMSESTLFTEMRADVAVMTQALRRLDLPGTFRQYAILEKYKDNIQEFLDLFLLWYRDAIVTKTTGDDRFVAQSDKKKEIYAEAQGSALASLYHKFDAVWLAKRNLRQNGNFQLTLEMLLLELAG